jgi:hypothetical protein
MNIFLKAYNNKKVLFCYLVDEKSYSKFQPAPLKLPTFLKILPATHFKDAKAAISTLKMLTGSRLWQVYSGAFSPAANERSALENSTNHREGNFEEDFSKHFQNY